MGANAPREATQKPALQGISNVAFAGDELEVAVARERVRASMFPALANPPSIGRYSLRRRVGGGGMSVVFSGYDPELEREVAIKVLRPERARSGDEDPHLKLLFEARAIARLTHPNVVSVFDVGSHEGRVFLVMELVRGGSLQDWQQGAKAWPEVVRVLREAACGLAAAHDAGIVHRDFKPSNVLFGEDRRVRVADFGLARISEPRQAAIPGAFRKALSATQSGLVLGTPAYMAPEQCLGTTVDARTDQFAFCVCLYELLFGLRPFRGDALEELRLAIVHGELQLPASAGVLPPALIELLQRGLEKQRDQRFASMTDVIVRLDALLRDADASTWQEQEAAPLSRTFRYDRYLAALPQGLDSHGECQCETSLLRVALSRLPLKGDLPEPLVLLPGLVQREVWVHETYARALLAFMRDRHFGDDAGFEAFLTGALRAKLASQFFGFRVPPFDSEKLMQAVVTAFASSHRGVQLAAELVAASKAMLRFRYPDHLFDELGLVELRSLARIVLSSAGARIVEATVEEQTATEAVLDVLWA